MDKILNTINHIAEKIDGIVHYSECRATIAQLLRKSGVNYELAYKIIWEQYAKMSEMISAFPKTCVAYVLIATYLGTVIMPSGGVIVVQNEQTIIELLLGIQKQIVGIVHYSECREIIEKALVGQDLRAINMVIWRQYTRYDKKNSIFTQMRIADLHICTYTGQMLNKKPTKKIYIKKRIHPDIDKIVELDVNLIGEKDKKEWSDISQN